MHHLARRNPSYTKQPDALLSSDTFGKMRDTSQPSINLPTVAIARYDSAGVQDNPKNARERQGSAY